MSLLMLAVVALFPVTLLAILLLTSGLEGRFVSSNESRHLVRPDQPQSQQPRETGNRSGTRSGTRHN